jgi:hypothetical protein
MMTLTGDEQDAIAANCGWCWAAPGEKCKSVTGKKRRRPHKRRIERARRRGVLGGVGRILMENWKRDGT